MKKNPFSIFDFLGYVFPGAFALLAVYYFTIISPIEFINPMSFPDMLSFIGEHFHRTESVVSCSVFLILSYIVGHILSYLSSITIEKFVIWWFGYPSEFLLESEGKYWHILHDWISIVHSRKYKYKATLVRTYFLRLSVSIALLPILIPTLLVKFIGCDDFFVKNLDPYLKDIIQKKRMALTQKLKLSDSCHYDKADYHRVIYHYEYENCSNHRIKMDNYVALYDFHRSITLIFSSVFMYVLGSGLFNASNIGVYFWIDLVGIMILSYLSFMSFFKFYRRFTLEAFMCLASDKDL